MSELDLKFIDVNKEKERKIRMKLNSLVLMINPGDAILEVREIKTDQYNEYHVSPEKEIVSYNFNADYDQKCFGSDIRRTAVADQKDLFYFYPLSLNVLGKDSISL